MTDLSIPGRGVPRAAGGLKDRIRRVDNTVDASPTEGPDTMQQRPRVLFVDDEPHLLSGLRRGLHGQGVDWEVYFADSSARALEQLAIQPCDAVVSDMRMPGGDGAQLLTRVQELYPGTVRFVLSGEADRNAVLSAAAATHQFLAKPCDIETVVAAVGRALALRQTVNQPELQELIGGTSNLPTLPAIYHELTTAMGRADCTVDIVAAILSKDVATSVEVLKLTNSAFFGIPRQIETVRQAVSMLGLDTVQALVVTGTAFQADQDVPGLNATELQQRALRRAAMIRAIGAHEKWPGAETTTVALASMLLDVGALVLARGRKEEFAQLRAAREQDPAAATDAVALAELERAHYGCSVTEASAYLLGLWAFSQRVVHLVAGQPAPSTTTGVSPAEFAVTLVNQRVLADGVPDLPEAESAVGTETWSDWNRACDRVAAAGDDELGTVA